jgi:hypothetical protein
MSPVHFNRTVYCLKCVNRNRRTRQLHIHLPCLETLCGQCCHHLSHIMTTWGFSHLCSSLSCGPVSARSMKVIFLFAGQFRCFVWYCFCVWVWFVVKLLLIYVIWGYCCGAIMITVLWDVASCRLVDKYRCFRGISCLHFQIRKMSRMKRTVSVTGGPNACPPYPISTLRMEVAHAF